MYVRLSHCKLLSRIFQVGYILRYNDSHIHSIPVGITTFSNTIYKQINAQAGNNIADPQPIKTYSKMFQSLKPVLKFDGSTFISLEYIGLGVLIILSGFPFNIVRNRQVWSYLNRSDLWCHCFHRKIFFRLSWNAQCFLIIWKNSYKLGNI